MLAVLLLGCGPSLSTDEGDGGASGGQDLVVEPVQLIREWRLDVLFVVEDSPAMASFQDSVAANLATSAFVAVEASNGERTDARIAVVTTTPGPDGYGAFVPLCDDPSLPAPQPTVARPGQAAALHPWIDTTRGNATYRDDASRAQAIACLGTRGTSGSEFPAPIAAVRGALQRMEDPGDPAHDFRRLGASLWVVFVVAGHDCSFEAGQPPDPNGPPAQCWSHGATCSSDDCVPSDAPSMVSLGETIAELRALEERIQFERGREFPKLLVSVVGGVGSDGSFVTRKVTDETFNETWGIGPGCTSVLGTALPPLRVGALADPFRGVGDWHWGRSLCGSSWTLFGPVYGGIGYIPIHCMPACAVGASPTSTEPLDCSVHLDGFGDQGPVTVPIPACSDEHDPRADGPCWESSDDDPFAELCAEDGTRPFRLVYNGETSLPSGPIVATCTRDPACESPAGP